MNAQVKGILIGIAVSLCLVVIIVTFMPVGPSPNAEGAACMSNLKQLGMTMQMYSTGNDDSYPAQGHWMDALEPMVKNPGILMCTVAWVFQPKGGPEAFGYAFNSSLSSQRLASVRSPDQVPMIYDSTSLGRNASDAVTSLPTRARHGKVNNIVFADGRVRAVPVTYQVMALGPGR